MNKKKTIRLLILLLCLASVFVAYYVIKNRPSEEVEEEAEQKLIALTDSECTHISYSYEGSTIGFVKKDDSWVMEGEEAFPLDSTKVPIMVNELNEAVISSEISDVTDLDQYGLRNPVLSVTASFTRADGGQKDYSLFIGDAAGVGSGRYVYFESDPTKVYLTDENIYLRFSFTREELFEEKKLPEFSADDVTGVLFMLDGHEKYDLVYSEDEDGTATGTSGYWKLLKNSTGEITECEEAKVQDILSAAASITFDHMADYREDHFSDYGIDPLNENQLLVWYRSSATETGNADTEAADTEATEQIGLIFGNKTEDGGYYVNVDGTPNVFVISAETIENFVIE